MGRCPRPRCASSRMRHFKDGQELYIEPWRAKAFPVIKDLVVDRARVRSDHRGGRIHQRADGQRAGWQHDSGAEGKRRSRHGCGGVHRLRGMRGGVSECVGGAVHGREDRASGIAAAGPAGAASTGAAHGAADTMPKASGAAPTSASARRRVRRRSRWK